MAEAGSAVSRGRLTSEVTPEVTLTPAEVRILELLPTHLTLAQVAAELFISRNTAKSQGAAIYRKLSVQNRDEAVCRARETGLLPAQADPQAQPSRGDDQARVLAFPTRPGPGGIERDPEALAPPRSWRPPGRIPHRAVVEAPTAVREAVADPDPVIVMARSSAARDEAREIRARAHEAQQMSLTLKAAIAVYLRATGDV